MEKVLYSTHIFILPFKILEEDDKGKRKEAILSNKEDWKDYIPIKIIKQREKESDSEVENNKNMLKYFTKYAKDALFKYGEDKNDNYVMELHNTKIKNASFLLECYKNEEIIKRFNLELECVKVKFFDTSVGTISFIVNNYETGDIEDVLLINNQGRKIYLAYEKEAFSIITIEKDGEKISQDISKVTISYEKGNEIVKNDIIGYFIDLNKIEPILDDRMYTISHYLDCNFSKTNGDNKEEFIKNRWKKYWYQYVFIDTADSKTCQDEYMEEELLQKSTYTRWKKYETQYGISRYSFMLWTNGENFSKEILNMHIKFLYFQLVNFVIAQKATIILLNEKINNILESNISTNIKEEGKKEYQEYLFYLAKMNFKEITCQEQGIEIYNFCRQQMDIEGLTEELDLKIKTLNERAERIRDEKELENDKKLNNIGMMLAILGTIFGILGIGEDYLTTTSESINIYGFFINILRDNSWILLVISFIIILLFKKHLILKILRKKQ